MDLSVLGALLWQSESEILDFKRDQYLFDSATDDERSELLKDILAFANAWRTSTAHILIGVEEVKGGRGNVVGATHLLNRTLQTFVQTKINRPITFSYEPVEFETKPVGVITIPVQDRPFFVTKAFGKLSAQTVYIRRGDTTSSANPDEVAQMGAKLAVGSAQPVLEFAFADLRNHSLFDDDPIFATVCVDVPQDEQIPAYGQNYGLMAKIGHENEDYYSDLAVYLRDSVHLQPLGVSVENISTVTAQHVVVRLVFAEDNLDIFSAAGRPAEAVKERMLKMMRPEALARSGIAVVQQVGATEVKIELGDIQPGTSAWSNQPFYVGCRGSKKVSVKISISGHNLSKPLEFASSLTFDVEQKTISLDQLLEMGDDL